MPNNFIQILGRHADCTDTLLGKASLLKREDLEFSTDANVIKIRKMINAVLGENHMMKAFVRLKPQGGKVLYGYMRPQHNVWTLVGRFFARRFPGAVIVLGNNSLSHVFLYHGEVLSHSKAGPLSGTLSELEVALGDSPTENADELWDTYYWSQYRKEAKNTQYFKQNMRAKYVKSAGITAETDSGGTRLEDFGE